MHKDDLRLIVSDSRAKTRVLTTAIAIMLALFVTLVSANVAFAWLVDTKSITDEFSISDIEIRLFAALYENDADGYDMVIAEGSSVDMNGVAPKEVFYDFIEDGDGTAPWASFAPKINTVSIECAIAPRSTAEWFAECKMLSSISGLNNIDFTSVADASRMFKDCALLENVDVTSWKCAALTSCDEMFSGCLTLKALDLSNFAIDSSQNAPKEMFSGCSNLEEIVVSPEFVFEQGSVPVPAGADADGFWYLSGSSEGISPDDVVSLVKDNYKKPNASSLTFVGYGRPYASMYGKTLLVFGRGIPAPERDGLVLTATYKGIEEGSDDFSTATTNLPPWNKYRSTLTKVASLTSHKMKPATMYYWFASAKKLEKVDLSAIDTQNVTSFKQLFYYCQLIETVDVSSWDTSNVETMESAFYCCSKLQGLDTSNWDTSNVTSMRSMFYCDVELKHLDISNWNVEKVFSFNRMFLSCYLLEAADMTKWQAKETSGLGEIDIYAMFSACQSLKTIDFSWLRGRRVGPDTGYDLFSTGYALREITLPTSIKLSGPQYYSPASNYDGVVNSNFWYQDAKGESYSTAEFLSYTNSAYRVAGDAEPIHWCAYKHYTDDDSYAAVYGESLMIVGKGSVIPNECDGMALCEVYREIEKRIGNLPNTKGVVPNSNWAYAYRDKLRKVRIIDEISPTITGGWFKNFKAIETIEGLNKLDMSVCVCMGYMFYCASSLESIDGIDGWNLSAMTYGPSNLFNGCTQLKSLDLHGWNFTGIDASTTGVAQTFQEMFKDCICLKALDVTGWVFDSEKTADAYGSFENMFVGCPVSCIDLSSWSVPYASMLKGIFSGASPTEVVEVRLPAIAHHETPCSLNIGLSALQGLQRIEIPDTFRYDESLIDDPVFAIVPSSDGLWFSEMGAAGSDGYTAREVFLLVTSNYLSRSPLSFYLDHASSANQMQNETEASVAEDAALVDAIQGDNAPKEEVASPSAGIGTNASHIISGRDKYSGVLSQAGLKRAVYLYPQIRRCVKLERAAG